MAQGTDVKVACLTHIVDMLVEGQLTVECDPEALHGLGRLNSDPGYADGGYYAGWSYDDAVRHLESSDTSIKRDRSDLPS